MKSRHICAAAAVAVLAAGVAACGDDGGAASGGGGKTGTVTIGGAFELSGTLAGIGTPVKEGAELAVDEINKQGFKVGDTTYKLKLVSRDNQSSPVTSVNVVRQFTTQDKIKFIVGPSFATAATPTFPLASKAGAMQLTVATTAEQFLGKPGYENLFRVINPDAARAGTMPAIVKDNATIASIAFVLPDDALGHLKATAFGAGFEKAGVTVTDTTFYPPGTTDFSTVVSKIAGKKPEAVYVGYPDASASQIIRQSLTAGITTKFVAETGSSLEAAKPYQDQLSWYSLTAFGADPNGSGPKVKEYADLYQHKFGKAPPANSYPGPVAYDTIRMLVAAMQKADTTDDVDKISAALHGLHFDGLVQYEMDAKGQVISGYDVIALEKGGAKKDLPVTLDQVRQAVGQ